MDPSNWKDRFSQKQLERKRLGDRLGQRRIRRHTKRAVVELEEKLNLLLERQDNLLIDKLMKENTALRASLDNYQAKMKSILLCSQQCLEEDEEDYPDVLESCQGRSGQPRSVAPSETPPKDIDSSEHRPGHCRNGFFISDSWLPAHNQVSIIFQIANFFTKNSTSKAPLSAAKLVDSIIAWKLIENHGLGFNFLIRHFDLDKEPICLSLGTSKIHL